MHINKRVYDFHEVDPNNKALFGGKGAGLAYMTQSGLSVPPGFTITSDCCPLFLDSDETWPDGLRDEVTQSIKRLEKQTNRRLGEGKRPLLVSVRSGAAVSMPGMMDTILNCGLTPVLANNGFPQFWKVYAEFCMMFSKTVGSRPASEFETIYQHLEEEISKPLEEPDFKVLAERYQTHYQTCTGRSFPIDPSETVFQCIEAVWHSWNSDRAKTYRLRNDIRGLTGTAVNVQFMFPSEISGIVFTTSPNAPETGEMIFEASYGLGESIVSGDVTPDSFYLDRESCELKRTVMGNKMHSVRSLGDTTEHDPKKLCLDQSQIQTLAKISLEVERIYQTPVDLEFGYADGEFSILQARAIRGIDVALDVELGRQDEVQRLKALAESSSTKRKLWVRHNLGETLPAPTPLTWDIMKHFMSGDGGFGRMYQVYGYTPSKLVKNEGFLELICGRIYVDPDRAAELFWESMPLRYNLDAIAKDSKILEAAPTEFDANRTDEKLLLKLPKTILGMIRSAKQMKRLRANVLVQFKDSILPDFLSYVKAKRKLDLTILSVPQLLEELKDRHARVMDDFGNQSLQPGFFGGMAQMKLQSSLVQLMGEETGKAFTLKLLLGLDGDMTIEQNEQLYKVAQGTHELETFIEKYGHRCVGEMELSTPRWREDTSYLERVIKSYKSTTDMPSPLERHKANARIRIEAESQLSERLKASGGSFMEAAICQDLKDAQALLPYRENGKYYLMQGYELIRNAITTLAERWNLGKDIFFLHWDELFHYDTTPISTEQIASRKRRWESAQRLDPANLIDSNELEKLGLSENFETNHNLEGDSISGGIFTGTARIVFDPNEARDLGQDYILVCPSTDPGWTALFAQARGLVIERGGILSHGAIVARDFGLPAVVCPNATKRIKEGATIRVDGNQGTVNIVNEG